MAQLSARISHSRSFEGAIPDIYKEDPGVRLRIMDGTNFWILLAYGGSGSRQMLFPTRAEQLADVLSEIERTACIFPLFHELSCSPLKIDLPSQVFLYKTVSRTTRFCVFLPHS